MKTLRDAEAGSSPPAGGGAVDGGRSAVASRTERILRGPIVPTMLRLGLPTLVVIVVQALVGVAETYFVSFLGTEALAGVALVFPVLMLMQMMANGGFGGGVASAIARAIGSGRRSDADALALHAVALAILLGLAFMAAALIGGPPLYRAMGGEAGALDAALTYSTIVFIGAVPLWLTALLAAALRGAGNVRLPAVVTFVAALVLVVLSPALIFGIGPFPRLGIAGAGIAVVTYYLASAAILLGYLRAGRGGIRLTLTAPAWRHFKSILGVGALSALGTIQANLTVMLVTGAVGLYGTQALAGYGIASRLDYLLIPLLFGLGTSAVVMVGTAVGAGDAARARRVAWAAAALGGGTTGLIGLLAFLFPRAWPGLFTDDAVVLSTSALYLRIVAPLYAVFGAGMMLYFASQGANRVLVPVIAGGLRLIVAGVIGWLLAAKLGIGLAALFAIVAAALALFGIVCVLAVRSAKWGTSAT